MKKAKKIASIVSIILIFSMYLLSFIFSFFATKQSQGLFAASVFCTVVIPIMIWIFVTVYKWVHRNDEPEEEDSNSSAK